MGRQPCCEKVGLKKGPWTAEEDKKLINFILTNGQCCWRAVPKLAGLLRCGKSCRLRWTNYLRPDLKRGLLSDSDEKLVIDLHSQIGNRWSKIAAQLPGRTDNEIKNHWNTHIKKKLKKMGIDSNTHKPTAVSNPTLNSTITTSEEEQQQLEKVQVEVTEEAEEGGGEHGKSSGFCIEDVPMVQPDEIMVPITTTRTTTASSSSSTTTASPTSSSSSSGSPGEFQFPTMDWLLQEAMELWGMDDDFSGEGLDFNWDNDNTIISTITTSEEEQQQLEKVQVEFTEEAEEGGGEHGKSSGFCIEDVPMVQPDEIMVPITTTKTTTASSSSSTTTASPTSSSSSSGSPGEFQFPTMDWLLQEAMELWGMDDDFNGEGLDFNWDNDNTINVCVDPFLWSIQQPEYWS